MRGNIAIPEAAGESAMLATKTRKVFAALVRAFAIR
jgi:hypothetical protein